MKKFNDARQPLSFLKHKMAIKASNETSYSVFERELDTVLDEHKSFQGNLELQVVMAEHLDPVQVCLFVLCGILVIGLGDT